MTPKVSALAFSLCRSGLPESVPRAVASTICDSKSDFSPAAAQFAWRVVGSGPPLRKRASHGSSAVVKIWLDGLNNSRSEEHTSELQSLMRISYAVFCLKKKNKHHKYTIT